MPTFKCQSCDKTFFFKSRFFKHLSSISHIRFSKGTQVPLGTLLYTNGQSILYKIDYRVQDYYITKPIKHCLIK